VQQPVKSSKQQSLQMRIGKMKNIQNCCFNAKQISLLKPRFVDSNCEKEDMLLWTCCPMFRLIQCFTETSLGKMGFAFTLLFSFWWLLFSQTNTLLETLI